MSVWKELPLEKIVLFQRGHDLVQAEMDGGQYPVAGSNGIIAFHSKFTTKGPGVTLGRSGNSIGVAHYYEKDFWAHNTTLYSREFYDSDPLFVYYLLKTIDFKGLNSGSAVPSLNRNHINSLLVKVPPLDVQKNIASLLYSLDMKITLLVKQNDTLEKMAETIFRNFFLYNAKNGWREAELRTFAEHSKISIRPQSNPYTIYFHYSIPSFDNHKDPVIEIGQNIQSNKYKVYPDCILFSKLNPHKDKRIWLIQDEVVENSICSTEFQVIRPKNKNFLFFLYGWLNFNENYREIASGVGGTSGSHQRIDPSVIFSFPCLAIDKKTLEDYNILIKPIFSKQVSNQKQFRTLTNLKAALLPKIMNGGVKISI